MVIDLNPDNFLTAVPTFGLLHILNKFAFHLSSSRGAAAIKIKGKQQ